MKRRAKARRSQQQRRGVALVVVMAAVTIMAVFVAELLENTSTDFHVTTAERDRLKAEYLAKSGINLQRLLIAREPDIRKVVGILLQPIYQGAPAPQLNVWDFSDMLLAPFADTEGAEALSEETGINFSMMEGIGKTGGTFEVITTPENGKVNLSSPLFFKNDDARQSIAMQLFGLMGGYQSPDSPYDPMFAARDPDGHFTTRLDIVSAMIDWWDQDQDRTVFDPGTSGKAQIATGGSEDDIYGQLADPYQVKNAPFDSLQELRLIRGVGDDFWATFIEGENDDPRERKVTVYASGAVNVNQARPEVLLSRLCPFVSTEPLCTQPLQAAAFIMLLKTLKSIVQVPIFPTVDAFLDFIGGGGGASGGRDIYAMLSVFTAMMPGGAALMAWTPLRIPGNLRPQIAQRFLVEAQIFTIQSTARVGRAQAKMSMVINFDKTWTPPHGVAASPPPLGVAHHYRLD
jgi:general secretion pathway protein K